MLERDVMADDKLDSCEDCSEWDEVYAALDRVGFPDEFLGDRAQGVAELREES